MSGRSPRPLPTANGLLTSRACGWRKAGSYAPVVDPFPWRAAAAHEPTIDVKFLDNHNDPAMERETAVESLFPVLDPISRNYPVRKGAVGVGFHTDPARGP